MLILKSNDDIKKMKVAGEISTGALAVAKETIRPGVSTAQVDNAILKYIIARKARPSFLGYLGFPNCTCISINEEVIHGIPSKKRIIHEGDIVSIDVGAIYEGFNGDNAYTFAVGEISSENQKLLDVTKECLFKAISVALPDNRIGDIGETVESYAKQNGFSVVKAYSGHGLGKKLHEDPSVPNFREDGPNPRIRKGMTIAIEPMINMGIGDIEVLKDRWTVVTKDGMNSAHFEMSIAITDGEPIILTDWREVLE